MIAHGVEVCSCPDCARLRQYDGQRLWVTAHFTGDVNPITCRCPLCKTAFTQRLWVLVYVHNRPVVVGVQEP